MKNPHPNHKNSLPPSSSYRNRSPEEGEIPHLKVAVTGGSSVLLSKNPLSSLSFISPKRNTSMGSNNMGGGGMDSMREKCDTTTSPSFHNIHSLNSGKSKSGGGGGTSSTGSSLTPLDGKEEGEILSSSSSSSTTTAITPE